jgi:hypothetical protein
MLTSRNRPESTAFILLDPLHLPTLLHRFDPFNLFNLFATASRLGSAGIGAGPTP